MLKKAVLICLILSQFNKDVQSDSTELIAPPPVPGTADIVTIYLENALEAALLVFQDILVKVMNEVSNTNFYGVKGSDQNYWDNKNKQVGKNHSEGISYFLIFT